MVLIAEDNGIGISIDNNKIGSGLKNINSRIEFLNGKLKLLMQIKKEPLLLLRYQLTNLLYESCQYNYSR